MLHYLEMAAEVANLGADTCRKAFIGAVAIRRDGTIVSSRNGCAMNPHGRVASIHAEAKILRKAGYGSIVYVARVKRDGSLAMAKPCHTCHSFLKARHVETVYYTISNTEWEGFKL
jgi:deoxycytidylate deaminase